MRFYELPDTLTAEENQFEEDIKAFARGEIDPVKFKAIRVAHGLYEQRQEHTYMLRIRCAAGGITPTQLLKVAQLGEDYGSGEVHFTTRQEVQIHNVLIQDVMKCIRGLREVGLSSRGGGGNTIRNILTSPDSGVSEEEVFDVDPYAIALTTRMVHEEDSWNLPRKFKIAMSHNSNDTAFTQATCLGFVAQMKDGQKGFKVFCAGGMGAKPMVGHELLDFIPDTDVYHVTKALKVMFDKHGNRRSKHASRIKFLWKKLDRETFVQYFQEEYQAILKENIAPLKLDPLPEGKKDIKLKPEIVTGDDYETWKKRYVLPQKQNGFSMVKIPLQLGDLKSDDAQQLCELLNHFGENTIRCDRAQNMRLRYIPNTHLGNVFKVITSLKHSLVQYPAFIGNMINCTGAQTCKLGICLPRGLSTAIREKLEKTDINLDEISDFQINMSGCPNTCGMHHVADLGFFGKIGRKEGELYPAYYVLAGAVRGMGETKYAQKYGEISAHYIPDFVAQFLEEYIDEKDNYQNYHDYLEQKGVKLIQSLCAEFEEVPTYKENPAFYTDFSGIRKMNLDDMGTAECSAGMFDMINVDRKTVAASKKLYDENPEEHAYKIMYHTARMLLVTRGLEGKNDEEVFDFFSKHFLITDLVNKKHQPLVEQAKNKKSLSQEAVFELADEVESLYKSMDDSLRFKVEKKKGESKQDANLSKDFRGVNCPMNFVKTKLVLETMKTGETLTILLDDGAPIENVPNSVKLEGHQITKQEQKKEGHWSVTIEKK